MADRIDFEAAISDLTLGELAEWEDATGKTIAQMRDMTSRDLAAIIWLVRRREQPSLTLDDVLRTVRLGDLAVPDEPGPFGSSGNDGIGSSVISPGR